MNMTQLKQEQLKMAEKVLTTDGFERVKYVAGCDQSYPDKNKVLSVMVVMDAETMEIVDKAEVMKECSMPYIPGFLFYREGPAIIEAFTSLNVKPDIIMVDGNGVLHPRRIGMASHLGISIDTPTIGIAKNLMTGKAFDGKIEIDKEIRGEEVKTRDFAKPVYVSPGHRISLRTAADIVRRMIIYPHKLPEPLHLAHRFARKAVKKEDEISEGFTAQATGHAS